MLNNGIRSSVSNCYKEIIPAGDPQIEYAYSIFKDTSDITLAGIGGNHELRTCKEVNIDVASHLYKKLAVPYLGIHGVIQLRFGKDSHGDPINYFLYIHHGSGGGSSRGGKTKKMLDQEFMVNGADIYARGHSHLIDAFTSSINQFNVRTKSVYKQNVYHVSTGNWLDTSDYAEIMEMPPLPIGCPTIKLNGKEKEIKVVI